MHAYVILSIKKLQSHCLVEWRIRLHNYSKWRLKILGKDFFVHAMNVQFQKVYEINLRKSKLKIYLFTLRSV